MYAPLVKPLRRRRITAHWLPPRADVTPEWRRMLDAAFACTLLNSVEFFCTPRNTRIESFQKKKAIKLIKEKEQNNPLTT